METGLQEPVRKQVKKMEGKWNGQKTERNATRKDRETERC
jgi:hypothetical protein